MASPIDITLLGKIYQVSCKEDEKEALIKSAVELNQRMQRVQRQGAVVGQERIAVMVALNLCNELQKNQNEVTPDPIRDDILTRMADKLAAADDLSPNS